MNNQEIKPEDLKKMKEENNNLNQNKNKEGI